MAEQAVSPMMQQYFEIKKQHPDEILFYRVGDFYEMFYDDALTASRELELTLTGKNCGKEERAPMCGVPFHSYETYVARLIAKGYKVAICEQMEDPALAKGLVKRDIIRVVTPGTVIESSMLAEDKNNYLCAIYLKKQRRSWRAGVCFADISTGEAYATELSAEKMGGAIITELCRYMPSEILINTAMLDLKDVTAYIKQHTSALVELREDACCKDSVIDAELTAQFGADWRRTCGFAEGGMVPYAVGMLLGYLKETQKHGIERIRAVQNYADAQYMRLSPVTRANLELTETMRGREKKGTLLWVLDKTETSMGKRLLRAWIEQPLVDSAAINARLDAVEALYQENVARGDLKEALGRVFDIERLTTRILYGSATPREVCALGDTCEALPQVRRIAEASTAPLLQKLSAYPAKAWLPISARKKTGLEELLKTLLDWMPEGPKYFPDDMVTDQPERVIVAEMVREKALRNLREEIPHGIGVEILSIENQGDEKLAVTIHANVYCEKESHKRILIGKQGEMLRRIGEQARGDIEKLLGQRVNLQLWVKVRPDWRNRQEDLKTLGYTNE